MDRQHTSGSNYCIAENFRVGVVQECLADNTLEIQITP